MVVFDVGANIGHFTLLSAKRVGPSGWVHSFEPSPREFAKLRANVVLNEFTNVELNPMAVCDHEGEISFQTCGDGLGMYNSIGRPFREGVITSSVVPCTTLDAYVRVAVSVASI